MIQQLLNMNNGKKFDVVLMNPPYDKNLHLKFLEKTIEIADNVVNISPHDWLTNKFAKTEKSKFRHDFREKYSKYIEDLEIISPEDFNKYFGTSNWFGVAIGVFKENAKEYREVLNLKKSDRTRDTFYSEILDLIASYECGLAEMIRKKAELEGRKITNWEVREVFKEFEELPHWKPLINGARTKMASRDLALRDSFHQQLESYIKPLDQSEYDKFLGAESDQVARLMDENRDVLKRLKERE